MTKRTMTPEEITKVNLFRLKRMLPTVDQETIDWYNIHAEEKDWLEFDKILEREE